MFPLRWTGLTFLLSCALSIAGPQQPPAQPSKPAPPGAPAPAPPQAPPAAPSAPDNKVTTTDAMHVLVLPMTGSYDQHQAAFERLGGFFAQRGASPLGPPVARYFSDPSTPEADRSWEVGFPVDASVKAEPPFEVKDIPGGLNAIHVHKGSYEELATVWPAFMQWVLASGYRPAGAPLHVFLAAPGESPQVELRIPVEK